MHSKYKARAQRQIEITKSRKTEIKENMVRNIFLKSKFDM